MRIVLAIAALAAAMLLDLGDGRAAEGPWCAITSIGAEAISTDCSMQTFEQCRLEVIAGNRGFCTQNPRWRGFTQLPVERRRPHRKHHQRHVLGPANLAL